MGHQKSFYHLGNVELFRSSSNKFLVDNLRERYKTHKRAEIPEPPAVLVPVIGYGCGYAQGKRAGNGWVRCRSDTATGTGGNLEHAGGYGYYNDYEYWCQFSWPWSRYQSSQPHNHKSFANIDNEYN